MISRTTARFRKAFAILPRHIQRQARDAYRLFQENPQHPSLHFKPIHTTRPIYSARIGIHYRAVGILEDETIVWFWVGAHAAYDQLCAHL